MLPSPPKFKSHLLFSSSYYAPFLSFFSLKFCKMWIDWVVGGDECYIPQLISNITFSLQVIILYFIFKPNPTYLETMCGFTFTLFFVLLFFGGVTFTFYFFKDKVLFFRETLEAWIVTSLWYHLKRTKTLKPTWIPEINHSKIEYWLMI